MLYAEGKPGQLLRFSEHEFLKTMKGHALGGQIISLVLGEEAPRHVLLKEVQHHPVSGHILHVDFHEISMTRKLRTEIPVRLVGTPQGVSQQGGVLEHVMRSVLVECLPKDLVEVFDVDVSHLRIGGRVVVKDIPVDPERYRLLSDPELALAAVAAPRLEEEAAEPDAAAAAAGEEPEVITEKKAAEGEADEAAAGGAKEGRKESAGQAGD